MPYDQQNDIPNEALLVLYANGDAGAARTLTLRLTPRVFTHAYRMLDNQGCGRRGARGVDPSLEGGAGLASG